VHNHVLQIRGTASVKELQTGMSAVNPDGETEIFWDISTCIPHCTVALAHHISYSLKVLVKAFSIFYFPPASLYLGLPAVRIPVGRKDSSLPRNV
jgi:hypothetical protein